MMGRGAVWMLAAGLLVAIGHAGVACADVVYLTQQRTISVATTGDGNASASSAPNFAPFTGAVDLATTLPGADGPVVNAAGGRIDCQINPNSIRALGSLSGSGGALQLGVDPAVGEAKATITVTFTIAAPAAYTLYVLPRPGVHATDQFELTLKNIDDHSRVVELSEADAPQLVDLSGVLTPGEYLFRYKVEATFDDIPDSRAYFLRLLIDCRADVNRSNGIDVQDIFDYLNLWFAGDARADFDGTPGLSTDDVLAYLSAWFAGC